MNIHFKDPSSGEGIPDTSEDTDGRIFYLSEIQKFHKEAGGDIPSEINQGDASYLCKRMCLISDLILHLRNRDITKKEYIELSQKINIDIILELDTRNLIENDGW